jgi:soluble cytochrome b562
MSITGIASNLFSLSTQKPNIQDRFKQFQQEFQQLGQDLQSGNLKAAQSDLAALQKLQPSTANGPLSSTSPMAQTLEQLGNDLKAGDLKDAQQLYSNMAQKFRAHHGHRTQTDSGQAVSEEMAQLQKALQTGNLTAAQQAYGTLAQDLQAFGLSGTSSTAPSTADAFSLQA